MTEREAWLELERCWRSRCVSVYSIVGLCSTLDCMLNKDDITLEMHDAMMRKVKACAGRHGGNTSRSYYWPLTADGARQRADFCKAMAEKCVEAEQ